MDSDLDRGEATVEAGLLVAGLAAMTLGAFMLVGAQLNDLFAAVAGMLAGS